MDMHRRSEIAPRRARADVRQDGMDEFGGFIADERRTENAVVARVDDEPVEAARFVPFERARRRAGEASPQSRRDPRTAPARASRRRARSAVR
jgi:hypothetical protein